MIDMQFFKQGQDLFCKEIAHISLNEKSYSPAVALFEAPFNWNLLCHSDKRTSRFLMFNYTKILFNLVGATNFWYNKTDLRLNRYSKLSITKVTQKYA